MISSNITTSHTATSLLTNTGLKTSTANAALFQSMLQSRQVNSTFGIGSVGTKTIISTPFQMSVAALAIVPETNATAAVFDENTPMSEYLDVYKRIYDKYAAVYGDGFEFTPCYSAQGNAASMAAEQRVQKMLDDFQRELHANIPSKFLSCTDPDFATKAAEKGLTLREYAMLNGFDGTKPVGDNYAVDTIEKMFYSEKYGLEGLSTQEQINKIMAQFSKGTCYDFNKGIGILYSVGAITGDESMRAISATIGYAHDEEFGKALEMYNYSSFEEFYKQYWANIILHMNNAASAKYDWEDVFRNNMHGSFSYDGHDVLTTKLFG